MELARLLDGRVSLVFVGNELDGDDGFGPRLFASISHLHADGVQLIDASTVPENFIGQVTDFRPDKVIVFDAGDFSGSPGDIRVFGGRDLSGASISSHRMPLKMFSRMFEKEGITVIFVLVQAGGTGIGQDMSPGVARILADLSAKLLEALSCRT
ncbi:hydrogenase maturation protease [Candidatus Altiarchaeota archaeon]